MLDYEDYEDDDGGSNMGEMDIHTCEQCSKHFTDRSNLKRHVRDIHAKRKLHQCAICSKTFSRKQHKEYHVKTCAHTFGCEGSKKFRMSVPDIKFYPKRLDFAFNGMVTIWAIIYPVDVIGCDHLSLLKESIKAMKGIILR